MDYPKQYLPEREAIEDGQRTVKGPQTRTIVAEALQTCYADLVVPFGVTRKVQDFEMLPSVLHSAVFARR